MCSTYCYRSARASTALLEAKIVTAFVYTNVRKCSRHGTYVGKVMLTIALTC